MKRIGLIFRDDMALAAVEGRKVQTRRASGLEELKARPDDWSYRGVNDRGDHIFDDCASLTAGHDPQDCRIVIKSRYGGPADRFVGREAFQLFNFRGVIHEGKAPKARGKLVIKYRSDEIRTGDKGGFKWRPSILMPDWASRIVTRIQGVTPVRLQGISELDAINEGIEAVDVGWTPCWRNYNEEPVLVSKTLRDGRRRFVVGLMDPRDSFRSLWESINGKVSWDRNPWVWKIQFERLGSKLDHSEPW